MARRFRLPSATVKKTMMFLAPVAAGALLLAGCSSSDDADSAAPTTTGAADSAAVDTSDNDSEIVTAALTCPVDEPSTGTVVDWELTGVTGALAVVGPTEDTAPLVSVETPLQVDQTVVETLVPGDGAEVTDASLVTVCYTGVNGRDGEVFDSAFERGAPAQFSPGGVIPGFRDALVGQQEGATVAVAMTSEDGYPQGTPDGAIEPGDTLVFALSILAVD